MGSHHSPLAAACLDLREGALVLTRLRRDRIRFCRDGGNSVFFFPCPAALASWAALASGTEGPLTLSSSLRFGESPAIRCPVDVVFQPAS
jgi:hypothetical protein